MRRFSFPFEGLLLVRRRTEERRQRTFADLDAQRLRIEETLRRQQRFIVEGRQALRDRATGRIDVAALRQHAGATLALMREAERLVAQLAALHQRLEAARAELREAARARRAIELLRERRFDAWRRRIGRAEDALLDEIAARGGSSES